MGTLETEWLGFCVYDVLLGLHPKAQLLVRYLSSRRLWGRQPSAGTKRSWKEYRTGFPIPGTAHREKLVGSFNSPRLSAMTEPAFEYSRQQGHQFLGGTN